MTPTLPLRLAAAWIALAAALPGTPGADAQDAGDAIKLRYHFEAGDRWTFDEDMTVKLKFDVLVNGNVAEALEQKSHKVRKGDLLVLAATGERLDAVRARFDPECGETEQRGSADPVKKPTGLAGQTVTLRRQEAVDAAVECSAALSDDEKKEARELIEQQMEGFLPKKPVKIGDRWVATEKAIARAFGLGPDDRGTLRLTFKALRDVAGRRTAEVAVGLVVDQKQDFSKITLDLEGSILIDVESGLAVGADLRGPVTISGETEQEDAEGKPAKISVEGGGEFTYRSTSRRLEGETASAPESAPESVPAPASGDRFGHMIFRPPLGWNATAYANGVVLKPTDLREGSDLSMTILQAMEFSGTLDQALERSWDDACAQLGCTKTRTVDGTAYQKRQTGTSFKGWEYVRGEGAARSSGSGDYYMNLFVVKLKGRLERIAVVSKEERYSSTGVYQDSRYYDVIQEFLFSVQFDDWKEPRLAPATLKGDGIVGCWVGISMLGGTFKGTYAIFFSNGQAYFGSRLPLHGMGDGFNGWVDAEVVPRYWGTYTFEKGQGVMKMSYGEIPIRSDGAALIVTSNRTDHRFGKLASVDGARFDGRWTLPGAYSDGRPDPSISFTSAGQFVDEGAVNVLNHGYPLVEAPGAGTYEVKDFTLLLLFSDGRRYRIAFPGHEYEKGNVRPSKLILSFNEDVLVRR